MKIQYKSEPLEVKSEKRYLRYRIEPSELSWWIRIFKNPWKYVYKSYSTVCRYDNQINDCLKFLFSAKEAHDIVEKYDTYEKLIEGCRYYTSDDQDKYCKEHHIPPVHWSLKQWRNQRTESGYPVLGPYYNKNF